MPTMRLLDTSPAQQVEPEQEAGTGATEPVQESVLPPQVHNKKTAWRTRMPGDGQLRTRVVRYLRDQEGEERTLAEIAEGTGLTTDEVRRGIDHNLFVDSLRPNLYYGVIAKREGPRDAVYRFNAVQYVQNRSRWIDAQGRERKRGGKNGGNDVFPDLKDLRVPNPLRWIKQRKRD